MFIFRKIRRALFCFYLRFKIHPLPYFFFDKFLRYFSIFLNVAPRKYHVSVTSELLLFTLEILLILL